MGQGQRTLPLFGAHEWLGCLLWVDQGGGIVCWIPKVMHLKLFKQRMLGGMGRMGCCLEATSLCSRLLGVEVLSNRVC